MITEGGQKLVQIARGSQLLTAFAAFAPRLLYEFLHRSKTGPPATGQSSQVSGQVWVQFAVLGAVLVAFEFLVDGTVGVLAGQIAGWLRRRQTTHRRIDAAVGGVFIGLGVRLTAER
jgi:hypothetical protein